MAKRSIVRQRDELGGQDEPILVPLTLLRDVKLKIVGKATGKEYNFNGAGSVALVDERDAREFLKRVSQSCCTGNKSSYFEIAR